MKLSLIDLIENLGDKIADLLFPPACIFCNQITKDKSLICEPCKKALKKQITDKPQSIYVKDTKYIDKIGTVFAYNDFTKNAVLNLKSTGRTDIVLFFGELLYDEFETVFGSLSFDAIIPVPMHKIKRKRKGFNQAYLIAKVVSKKTKIPVISDALIKPKHKKEQKKLSSKERRKNAKKAYECLNKEKISGKRLLLVDDVMTTGSTADECARVLIESGAENVSALVIASTVLNQ